MKLPKSFAGRLILVILAMAWCLPWMILAQLSRVLMCWSVFCFKGLDKALRLYEVTE